MWSFIRRVFSVATTISLFMGMLSIALLVAEALSQPWDSSLRIILLTYDTTITAIGAYLKPHIASILTYFGDIKLRTGWEHQMVIASALISTMYKNLRSFVDAPGVVYPLIAGPIVFACATFFFAVTGTDLWIFDRPSLPYYPPMILLALALTAHLVGLTIREKYSRVANGMRNISLDLSVLVAGGILIVAMNAGLTSLSQT